MRRAARLNRATRLASAGLCLLAAVLWSMPMLASGLVALLRYGFGSVFVVGESVAAALLQSAGADIAVTVGHLQADPATSALQAAAGLMLSAAAANLVLSQPALAAGLAALSGAEAWWYGLPPLAAVLAAAVLLAAIGVRG